MGARNLAFLTTCLIACYSSTEAQSETSAIRKIDFQRFLTQRDHLNEFLDCPGPSIKEIHVEYGKLLLDETEQAVVEATTCAIVQGGADILEVFRFGENGVPISLPIDDSAFSKGNLYEGKSKSPHLGIIDGKLTRWYIMYANDSSANPKAGYRRKISYRWSGKSFVVDKVLDIPPNSSSAKLDE